MTLNPRLKAAFEKYIEEENKPKTYGPTYSGMYGGSGRYPGQYGGSYNPSANYSPTDCTIFFYEWSNLRSGAKHFKEKKEFFKFLQESNITLTEQQKKDIEDAKYKNIFATCKPNKAELLTADTWYVLNNLVTSFITKNTP